MRLRATIAYDGTDFRGWAPQPDVRTVGGVVAEALGVESLVVAGRTDAGVHAAANVVSFDAERELPAKAVNTNLPSDVAVLEMSAAPDGFDARADARGRSYVYRINNGQAVDPWGHGLIFRVNETIKGTPKGKKPFELYSVGPDGQDDGGKDDDILP